MVVHVACSSPLSFARGLVVPELAGVVALEASDGTRFGVIAFQIVETGVVVVDEFVQPINRLPVQHDQDDHDDDRIPAPLHRREHDKNQLATDEQDDQQPDEDVLDGPLPAGPLALEGDHRGHVVAHLRTMRVPLLVVHKIHHLEKNKRAGNLPLFSKLLSCSLHIIL